MKPSRSQPSTVKPIISGSVEKPKLIVFDLNKTLIRENSWLNLNLAMGVTEEEDSLLMRLASEGIINDSEGQDLLCRIYKKRGQPTRANIQKILEDYSFLPTAEETIKELQKRGNKLVIISGAMDLLVESVAKKLGIDEFHYNNSLEFDQNNLLTNILTIDNDEQYKLHQLEQVCQKLSIELTDCMCVGDGDNDILLFKTSRCGVTFADSPIKNEAKYTISQLQDILKLVK